MIIRLALAAALALSSAAFAQGPPPGPPPPGSIRLAGVVTAVDSTSFTVKDDRDGKETKLKFTPNLRVMKTHSAPFDREGIKPGAIVASLNVDQPDGSARAINLLVGSRAPAGNGPAPYKPGGMVTHGSVSKVTKTNAGLELEVAYPGGTRRLVVPSDAKVSGPGAPPEAVPAATGLKVGEVIHTLGVPAAGGGLESTIIVAMEADSPDR